MKSNKTSLTPLPGEIVRYYNSLLGIEKEAWQIKIDYTPGENIIDITNRLKNVK